MKLRLKIVFLTSWIVALALLGTAFSTAAAQSQTVLFITPEQTDVPLGNQAELEVEVYLGLNINAFDLTLTYDPDVLSLADWEHGDYLSNQANIKVEDDAGRLRIAATQLAKPAVSGDGVLLVLTFDTVAAGSSPVEWVEATFADSQGNKTEPVLEDGLVDVVVAATYTPTPTPTQTSTPKPTVTTQPTNGDTGYPVKVEPTATTAAAQGYAPTDGAGLVQDVNPTDSDALALAAEAEAGEDVPEQSAYPGVAVLGGPQGPDDSALEQNGAAPTGSDSGSVVSSADALLNILLWLVLAVGVLVLVVMMFIAIRRPKRKHEDYLL